MRIDFFVCILFIITWAILARICELLTEIVEKMDIYY